MVNFKRTLNEVVKGEFISPDTAKEEQDVFKPTDPVDEYIPVKETPKKRKRTKKGE